MKLLLKQIIDQKKLSLRQVEILTKVGRSTLSAIVNEKSDPRLGTLEQIAKGLHVKITDLFESEYK